MKTFAQTALLLPVVIWAFGCGEIVDPDNIVVAEVDGKAIRQGEVYDFLRRLDEVDRPLIQTKADIVAALNKFIDDEILQGLADEMSASNLIAVPRDAAKQSYFRKHPEDVFIYEIPDPKLIDRTQADLEALRAQAEFGIDDEQQRLLRGAALGYLTRQAVDSGALKIDDAEFEAAFSLDEDQMKRNEFIEFVGIRFPASTPDAASRAAAAQRRVEEGIDFDVLVEEIRKTDPSLILESGFENNPMSERFATFWEAASGANEGDVLLAFLPPFTMMESHGGAMPREVSMEAGHLLFNVIKHEPARTLTLDEARPILADEIYRRKMMQQLREQHGVKVYPEKLSDPAGLGDQFKGSTIKLTPE